MHKKNLKRSTGENRFVRFYPGKNMQAVITADLRLTRQLLSRNEYQAGDILDTQIFKINPNLKKATIVVKDTGAPARFDLDSKKIFISPSVSKQEIELYLVHELQHYHDHETLGLFKKLTVKELNDITKPHEKRAYIAMLNEALRRGYREENLQAALALLAGGQSENQSENYKILSGYLDEALKQVQQ